MSHAIETKTHIDLFSGLGGFSLAAQANGVRTIVQCESEAFLRAGLDKAWGVPIVHDVRKFDGREWRGAWLLTAGTPCQPASRAGDQRGAADDRWLWPETIRITAEARPAWALYENPPGIDDVGLGGIIAEVAGLGYEVGVCRIPACAVNSPQDRDRFWIVANRSTPGSQIGELHPGISGQTRFGSAREAACVGVESLMADSPGARQTQAVATGGAPAPEGQKRGRVREPERASSVCTLANGEATGQPSRQRQECARWTELVRCAWEDFGWVPMPARDGTVEVRRAPTGLYELAHGLPSRLPKGVGSRLIAALGNAICWPIAAEIIGGMIASEK